MEEVRGNLVFSLDSWPEIGLSCDFVLNPAVFSPYLAVTCESGSGESPKLLTSLRGQLNLQLTGHRLRIKGAFAVKVEMFCDRCLSPFVSKIADKIDEIVDLVRAEALTPEEEMEGVLVILSPNEFDLTPLMAELFWLSWPLKLICREDCAGLCPSCGTNLNETTCNCSQTGATRH